MSDAQWTMLLAIVSPALAALANYLKLAPKLDAVAADVRATKARLVEHESKCAVCEQRLTALETGTIAR